ncbi:MarR family winged helix-turn-helix transcriptional regulator [Alteraurantiacibacter buctensis]|uniref:Winged helix DNA-binding protein n=1 Tax=Alteraurantiacibacter buctensis TaxID=1503981 RepID=A0A844Z2P7_9SPHN|nr:MarR family transcriptional regulator [Alteraurantiacibacter buctensis]MXO72964.1 winged helix DNA-binding protein [Alteraurantiacibacter buctensis]
MSGETEFGPIAGHVGFQVHLTWRAIRKRMLLRSRRAKPSVPRGAFSIPLLIGYNPGISPRDLADALFLDQSKVALFLRELEAEDLITRTPSPEDGRKVHLSLTDKGRAYAEQSMLKSQTLEEPIAAILSEDEQRELVRLLIKVQQNL